VFGFLARTVTDLVPGVYGVSSYGPNTGSRDGGTEVTIIGQNFVQGVTGCNPAAQSTGDPDCAVCFFGNGGSSVAVPAIVVSSTEVRYVDCYTSSFNLHVDA
jgi:hypothetical protein